MGCFAIECRDISNILLNQHADSKTTMLGDMNKLGARLHIFYASVAKQHYLLPRTTDEVDRLMCTLMKNEELPLRFADNGGIPS